MLDIAQKYAGRGWRVFPVTLSKVPFKDSNGVLDATSDATALPALFARLAGRRRFNLALATGELVVLDADGPSGLAALLALAKPHATPDAPTGLPRTLTTRTPRGGFHFIYRGPPGPALRGFNQKRPKGHDGLDVKAYNGYVLLPPSRTNSGAYEWALDTPIADLPDWAVKWIETTRGRLQLAAQALDLGNRPNWLIGTEDLTERAIELVRAERPPIHEFLSELYRIPASIDNETWFIIGCGIHDWDSGADGLAIFKTWSRTSDRHDWAEAEPRCDYEWPRMKISKPGKTLVTWYRVYREAANWPAKPKLQPIIATIGKINGNHAPHSVFDTAPASASLTGEGLILRVQWVDLDEDNNPRPTCTNAAEAIRGLGITCTNDTFHDRLIVGGHFIQQWAGDLTDAAVHMLRRHIKRHFRFDPGERNTRDAAVQLCLESPFNPVVDYLASLQWDGRSRIGRWVVDYLGCPDEPLGREFGRLMLVAAVRRARRPGTKFDQILVMEGREGTGKSTALRILAGDANFSDQRVLGVSEREQQEAIGGVWIHEIAELAGMRRAEVEAVKAFASKLEDRARPAYGRFRADKKRQCVFVATTNADAYLKSDTGDRRFWPLCTGRINLDALARDRDQIWAEAAHEERNGESLSLDWRLWPEAARAQSERQETDPWLERVGTWISEKQISDTSVSEVLENFLHLQTREYGQTEQNRIARTLRHLGFTKYQKRMGETRVWRYQSGVSGDGGDKKST